MTATSSVTITALPVATFSYSGTPFCKTAANPSPTFSGGGVAGTFSSTPGLVFVSASTGQIDLAASTPGTYTVTNTIAAAGGCPQVTATSPITITALPTVSLSYGGSPYCKSLSALQSPALTGTGAYTGGTYSVSPGTGLTINASGQITPSSSTAGSYVVTYTTPASGGCSAVSTTATVVITAVPTATISYAGPFCSSNGSSQAVSLSGTGAYTGGSFSAPSGLTIDAASGAITPGSSTPGTYTVTYTIPASAGCAAVPVTTTVVITAQPAATISYGGTPFCRSVSTAQNVTFTGTTGGTYSASPAGLSINSTSGAITPSTSTAGSYVVTYTVAAAGGCAQYTTTTNVIITAVPTATISYPGSPFCSGETGAVLFLYI